MSPKQKKLAAKAPPPNKIDEKDFKVLREEKAKGRGMGLQDEKVQPGKVMKAKMGVATDYKKYLKGLKKATSEVKKNKGKGHYDKENVIRHIRINKKMGGGMMKKYSKGGGADSGRIGEMKSRIGVAMNKAKRLRSMDRLTDRDIEKAKSLVKGKMGGGMIGPSQRPGYSKGTMVKARGCKLGRTRPTKIT